MRTTVSLSLVIGALWVGCGSASGGRGGGGDPIELRAAIDALLPGEDAEDRSPIALLLADPAGAVYAETWTQEGTGIGLAVVIAGGAEDERLEVFTPDDAFEGHGAAIAKARKTLARRLEGRAVRRLEGQAWPIAAAGDEERAAPAMQVAGLDVTLAWAGTQIEARDAGGERLGLVDWSLDVEEPHVGAPLIVYAAPGVRTLLVSVAFDPGESYGEYNTYASTYRLDLR